VPKTPIFTVYNIYSKGGNDTAISKLTQTLEPSQSAILIGDFNCHHPWWYGDCKSTHNGIKARYISPNSRTTVEWLESNNFMVHNIPGVLTHFPRAANRNPSIIDLAFSRGAIKDTVENWIHIRESTLDYSIIELQLIAPQCIINIRDKTCRIRAWAKADWPLFHRSIQLKELNMRDIKSKSESVIAVDTLYSCLNECLDKAVPKTKMRSKFAAWWSPNLEWLTTRVKRARKRLILEVVSLSLSLVFINYTYAPTKVYPRSIQGLPLQIYRPTLLRLISVLKTCPVSKNSSVKAIFSNGNMRWNVFPISMEILEGVTVCPQPNLSNSKTEEITTWKKKDRKRDLGQT
jgi:hypothetical protein